VLQDSKRRLPALPSIAQAAGLFPVARPFATLIATLTAGGALAQNEQVLDPIVVTATRTEADATKVPATITRITRGDIDRRLPADEAELFANEPDIAFGRDARRFGATRPNIRGIDDNRVLQLVDGVRMPSFFNGGGPTNFTMNAPLGASPEFLKRVEILRGPASSLYGSDAIGGVVGYLTLDPADLLQRDRRLGARVRTGLSGANDAATLTVLGAGRSDALQWLLGATQTDGHGFDSQGNVDTASPTRTRPNPQDVRDRSAIAKVVLDAAAGHKFSFTAEGRDQDSHVDVLRLASSLPKVTTMDGDDHATRARASVLWEHRAGQGWYDRLSAQLYHQRADSENFNRQTRSNTSATCSAAAGSGNDCLVEQNFSFEQTLTGAGVQLDSAIGERHLLSYGVDAWRVRTEELRDARIRNLTLGTTSQSLAGDTFPLRDFAPGYTDTIGVFVQDEIQLRADGSLTLVPALRYDRRALRPEPDALSQAVLASIGKQAVAQTDGAFSPKLAAAWRFAPDLAAYGQVVRGFRAPNYEEVNGHFRNSAQSYGISPNPNLKPETSTGVELGLRLDQPTLRAQLALFDNRYRDFIASTRLTCPADPNCITGLGTTFMSVNLSRVRIWGAERRASWDASPGWRVDGALAHARGSNRSSGAPLDSVEPARATLALVRDAGTWGAEARLRASARVKRVDDSDGTWFRPPGYGVVDFALWLKPSDHARITFALNNAFDKTYWLWSDIRLADARNPASVEFYSQPGMHASARLELAF
jgi:hemoglobin/transferrin/lactoferrin receptor protein